MCGSEHALPRDSPQALPTGEAEHPRRTAPTFRISLLIECPLSKRSRAARYGFYSLDPTVRRTRDSSTHPPRRQQSAGSRYMLFMLCQSRKLTKITVVAGADDSTDADASPAWKRIERETLNPHAIRAA